MYLSSHACSSGFPGGSLVKNPPANVGDTGDMGLIPGSGRSPGRGQGHPPQSPCLKNPMDRGAWRATALGVLEFVTAEHPHTCTAHHLAPLSPCCLPGAGSLHCTVLGQWLPEVYLQPISLLQTSDPGIHLPSMPCRHLNLNTPSLPLQPPVIHQPCKARVGAASSPPPPSLRFTGSLSKGRCVYHPPDITIQPSTQLLLLPSTFIQISPFPSNGKLESGPASITASFSPSMPASYPPSCSPAETRVIFQKCNADRVICLLWTFQGLPIVPRILTIWVIWLPSTSLGSSPLHFSTSFSYISRHRTWELPVLPEHLSSLETGLQITCSALSLWSLPSVHLTIQLSTHRRDGERRAAVITIIKTCELFLCSTVDTMSAWHAISHCNPHHMLKGQTHTRNQKLREVK